MKYLTLFGLLISCVLSTSCKNEEFSDWANALAPRKQNTCERANLPHFSRPDHELLKSYFSALAQMAYSLKDDPNKASRLNAALMKADLKAFCSQTLVDHSVWTQINQTCTRNGFYLCAEEVRFYPEAVAVIRSQLSAEVLTRFDAESLCRGAL